MGGGGGGGGRGGINREGGLLEIGTSELKTYSEVATLRYMKVVNTVFFRAALLPIVIIIYLLYHNAIQQIKDELQIGSKVI